MNEMTGQMSSGYTCPNCGAWVPFGTSHLCGTSPPTAVPFDPVPLNPFNVDHWWQIAPLLERFVVAAEKIAAALEEQSREPTEPKP